MATRLRSGGQKILGEVTFMGRSNFSPGLLPTMMEVIEVVLFRRQMSKEEAAAVVADWLREHWIFQNIYTIQKLRIKKKVMDLYEEFTALSCTCKTKRTEAWISNKLQPFLTRTQSALDIFCKDQLALKKQ